MGLRAEVVHFAWLNELEDSTKTGSVGEIAVVEVQATPRLVRVLV